MNIINQTANAYFGKAEMECERKGKKLQGIKPPIPSQKAKYLLWRTLLHPPSAPAPSRREPHPPSPDKKTAPDTLNELEKRVVRMSGGYFFIPF